jgi:hypothetical protein
MQQLDHPLRLAIVVDCCAELAPVRPAQGAKSALAQGAVLDDNKLSRFALAAAPLLLVALQVLPPAKWPPCPAAALWPALRSCSLLLLVAGLVLRLAKWPLWHAVR